MSNDVTPEQKRKSARTQLRGWQIIGAIVGVVGIFMAVNGARQPTEVCNQLIGCIDTPHTQEIVFGIILAILGVGVVVWAAITLGRDDRAD